MDTGLVSVIIPAFNAEKYLADSIRSVQAQTYSPIEIIVVDDGSQDNNQVVAKSFGDAIQYVFKEHGGIGSARNIGVEHAIGDWKAFLDADDFWIPSKLEIQHQVCRTDPSIEAVFGHAQNFISTNSKLQPEYPIGSLPGFVPGTMYIRRIDLQRIGTFTTKYQIGDSVDFYLRLREAGIKFILLPDVVLYRRIHEENIGVRLRDNRLDYLHILKAHLDRKRGVAG